MHDNAEMPGRVEAKRMLAAPETLEKHSPCSRVYVSACSDASLYAWSSKVEKLHFCLSISIFHSARSVSTPGFRPILRAVTEDRAFLAIDKSIRLEQQ